LLLLPIQVFPVKNFQVFLGFTTAHICPRRQSRINRVIQSYLTFDEVASIKYAKSGGNDD
jgi:hypothetical protein